MSKIISTDQLIKKSAELINIRGYYNTSIADVADFCGLKKASVYHHVSSKKDLGLQVLKYFYADVNRKVFSVAFDKHLSKEERLSQFINAIGDYYSKSLGGCLVGNFSLETAGLDEDFRALCQEYFEAFKKAFQYLLSDLPPSEALLLSEDAIALIQGHLMAAQVQQDDVFLRSLVLRLHRCLYRASA